MACAPSGEGKALVILGERGGSAAFPRGVLRWGLFDLGTNEFQFLPGGERGAVVTAPGAWPSPEDRRDITGLFLDQDNTLWASAVMDGGDWGPFHSVVYAVASVDVNKDLPVLLISDPAVGWKVPGHKIEGLVAPPDWSGDDLLLATFEDELMGGEVLILQKSQPDQRGQQDQRGKG